MSQRIRLTILAGSFDTGFPCTLQYPQGKIQGFLPPATLLPEIYTAWKDDYYYNVLSSSRIKAVPTQVTHLSRKRSGSELVESLNKWLNSEHPDWQKVRDKLIAVFTAHSEVEFIVESDDIGIRQLPLHTWKLLFESFPKVELALGASSHEQPRRDSNATTNQVRILAIFGDSTGLNLAPDYAELAKLMPPPELEFLQTPTRDFLHQRLWNAPWQVLFFAGHSVSSANGKTGEIAINDQETLDLSYLREALRNAVEQGLQLAIFNSCDGLGLAKALEDLHIPAVIVMREPVPDVIAQKFLTHFLMSFSQGKTLFAAMHEARQKLRIEEERFPAASWLPVLCLNPAIEHLPLWQELCPVPERHIQPVSANVGVVPVQDSRDDVPAPVIVPPRKPPIQRFLPTLASSLLSTALILGVRSLGWLEPIELWGYDRLMASRIPTEQLDSRLLVVGITENDLETYGRMNEKINRPVLTDDALLKAIGKLQQSQPKVIGLDVVRDIPLDAHYTALLKVLQASPSPIISPCAIPDADNPLKFPSYKPPKGVATERQGFINLAPDRDDIVRRYVLAMSPAETADGACNTSHSLSLRLAARYFGQTDAEPTEQENIKIANAEIDILRQNGSYQSEVSARNLQGGYQVLINYRSSAEVAKQITLADLLNNKIDAAFIQNKVVLIGYVAKSAGDDIATPLTRGRDRQMPGVLVHAHTTSQLLSFVSDHRPLMRPLTSQGDAIWIGLWGLVGAGVAMLSRRSRVSLFFVSSLMVVAASYIFLCYAWWLPVASALINFSGGYTTLIIYNSIGKRRSFQR
jgi:CHASE2 domain-containing sensor protein